MDVWPVQFLMFGCFFHGLRIGKLCALVHGKVPADRTNTKKDAWLCKSFCVLVRRKLARGKWTMDVLFNKLLKTLGTAPH